ncbi:MAG: prephenate dehydratase [Candidatus Rifleibacteriota bacterium]
MTKSKLEELRQKIDTIDEKLLELLDERTGLAGDIYRAKQEAGITEAYNAEREISHLETLHKLGCENLTRDEIDKIFLQIFSIARSRQKDCKVCVFGEKHGWIDDSAMERFSNPASLCNVDNIEDFLVQTDSGNLGFACMTPQFNPDYALVLESLLSGKISIVEEFNYTPDFCIVSNSARDLSEAHELCTTNEMLKLLRGYFLSMSFDLKIKICRSMYEVYENLQSINPVAAILPANLVKENKDLVMIRENLKSDLLVALSFMVFSKNQNTQFKPDMKASILCATSDSSTKLWEMLAIMKSYNVSLFDLQSTGFENKPWSKLIKIDLATPNSKDELDRLIIELEKKSMLVKLCGIYPVYR